MATSPISTNETLAAQVSAANRSSAQKILTSLNAGSGVDVVNLAQNLVDAEKVPRENLINAKIERNDNKISGLSAVMFMMDELKTNLSEIKDKTNLNSLSLSNSNPNALTLTSLSNAEKGSYDINIKSLAMPQRTVSSGFTKANSNINGGNSFNLKISSNKEGVSAGVSSIPSISEAQIISPVFGSPPSVDDFFNFSITIDSNSFTFKPAPNTATLDSLAQNIQSELLNQGENLKVFVENNNLKFKSNDVAKHISDVSLSLAVSPNSGTLRVESPNEVTIIDPLFGMPPSLDDFKNFSITLGSENFTITPSPEIANLSSLANDLNNQLQALDEALTVSFENGNSLVINSSDPEKTISDFSLVASSRLEEASVGKTEVSPKPSTSAIIRDISYGITPSSTDFKNFQIILDGKNINITPSPESNTLIDLAKDIQNQIQTIDGTEDITIKLTSNNDFSINSSNTSREISGVRLTQSATIRLDNQANSGIVSNDGTSISGIEFGKRPSVTDFSTFTIKIGDNVRTVIPLPDQPTLESLANDIQNKLRILEGNEDIIVSIDNGTLSVTSESYEDISRINLTKQVYADTPQGIAAAINDFNPNFSAEVINDGSLGNPFKILVTGASGSNESFELLAEDENLINFLTSDTNKATDANIVVNGVDYTRKSNSFSDVIKGVTIDLKSKTSEPVTFLMTQDTSKVKEKLQNLVTAYNDFNDIITETTNPESELELYGKTLVGDSTIRMIRQQIRSTLFGSSSTPGVNLTNLGDIGFQTDRNGVVSLDENKLDSALSQNYDDVVKILTGDRENLSEFGNQPSGIAGDAVKKLTRLLSSTGPLVSKTESIDQENGRYEEKLQALKLRMDDLLIRYTREFARMESIVGNVNSQKDSLKSTFEGMMSMYTNK